MTDEACIRRTLALARRAEGMTSPNPMVGAVLVKHGRIIAEGYHRKAGTAHAEVIAIGKAGPDATGSTLYVSLEPCCHKDKRTPPCTETIIMAGIKRVVIAMEDPNPKVSGKGTEELGKAGIEVVSGILEEKARHLNEFYTKHIITRLPFVILKMAMTLDGKIATPEGESKWITGEKARKEVHGLRGKVDAIMTAIGTIRADDPMLTCRTGGLRSPMRIILDPDLQIGEHANVLNCPPRTVLVCSNRSSKKKRAQLQDKGISLIEHAGSRVDLQWLMKRLGAEGIVSVLIEGGSSLASSCLETAIVDKVICYIAPKIIGGEKSFPAVGGKVFRSLQHAHVLTRTAIRSVGDDFVIEGYLNNS
ncbi:MAG: bifunctional diaminohydroxyphosphoribosylaminopyrimidine deaminase/5-amino-6-(5-phosphoribosylamino)uracil reductase RibD [Nitrospirae bacterium]|nr:bifunctional diaminohydroxyphosphoribosylaminopyrimidine deaminase/5-amino-6-(5-phosphoribosylamino)uracil reductase RibD [Nitrospirota bacterium]